MSVELNQKLAALQRVPARGRVKALETVANQLEADVAGAQRISFGHQGAMLAAAAQYRAAAENCRMAEGLIELLAESMKRGT